MEKIIDDNHQLSEEQTKQLSIDVGYIIIMATRLQLEGYIEHDIDKTNTANSFISLLHRLKLLPDNDKYSQVVMEIWDMYRVPNDLRTHLANMFNAEISEYNQLVMAGCRSVIKDMQQRGMVNENGDIVEGTIKFDN